MQILARIPVLTSGDEAPVGCATPPSPAADSGVEMMVAPAAECDEPMPETPAAAGARAEPSSSVAERPRLAVLPTPSILVLSMLAIAMWVAALRNDRLRLEAARQARAERMAQVVPTAGGQAGSHTR